VPSKWTEEETILAMYLYTRIPFGRINKTNKEIVEMAKLIGRTPSAVALKMCNIAHHDKTLQERNVKGLSNGSKLDGIIYGEYHENLEELSYRAQKIISNYKQISIDDRINELELSRIPEGKDVEYTQKQRVGQYAFRMAILSAYENRCCITGLNRKELLRASHIKPWKDSDDKTEKTNPCNGICLNVFHDVAFDKGLMTINKEYEIVYSSRLQEMEMDDLTKRWLLSYNNKKIYLPERYLPSHNFLEYHNDVIFLG